MGPGHWQFVRDQAYSDQNPCETKRPDNSDRMITLTTDLLILLLTGLSGSGLCDLSWLVEFGAGCKSPATAKLHRMAQQNDLLCRLARKAALKERKLQQLNILSRASNKLNQCIHSTRQRSTHERHELQHHDKRLSSNTVLKWQDFGAPR